ncbi:MAG TPA: efflux RND transporter permease subunit, partial [Nevskiaceae bacterium]|nr:efflux RND transporter permease subunit [Nevskiaceae bacterium]
MNLTEISLKRPVTVTMFFVCVAVIGVIGATRLPLESCPDIQFPGLQVTVPYRNSTPEEVERHITRPVEEALATLSGVKHIYSESREDGAEINLEFDWGQDLATKGVEARDKVDALRPSLPQEVERVLIQKFNAGDQAMLTLRISSGGRDLSNAYDMLNRNLKLRLNRIEGVSRVDLYGVEQKQIRVDLSAEQVAAHGIDLGKLADTLKNANFALTAGNLVDAGSRYFVKPEGRFKSLDDVRNFVVNDQGLRLGDIAGIVYSDPVLTYGRHLNQRYAIGLDVYKETGANLVEVSDRAKAELEEIRKLPEMAGINVITFNDSADDVRRSLHDLEEAGAIGALLSVLVLWFFMRDLTMTLIVTLSVPLSLLMTLAAMFFLHYTINVLTLMGLMLSIGMLVDNSVVVTESIFKERAAGADTSLPPPQLSGAKGEAIGAIPGAPAPAPAPALRGTVSQARTSAEGATLAGVKRVGLAVLMGTLATSIVFLPNIFGRQNDITVYLSHVAVTICCSLAASLLVAITLIPQLTTRLAARHRGSTWLEPYTQRYMNLLRWTLHHPYRMTLFILLLLGSVAIPVSQVKNDFFPNSSDKRLVLQYNLNGVYRLAKVEEAANTIENWLAAHKAEFEIDSVYTYYSIERAQTLIGLKDPKTTVRTKSGDQIKEEIRKGLPKIAIGDPSFDNQRGGGQKLSVQVYGEVSDELHGVAKDVARVLRGIPGLTDVRIEASAADWEVRVRVDRDRARQNGLSSQQVAEIVAGAMRGTALKPYRTPTGEIEMVLEFSKEDRLDLDALRALPIITPTGARVALATVADLSIGDVPGIIKREDRHVSLNVSFGTAKGVTADDAKKRATQALNELQFPSGYGWAFGRAFNEEDEDMGVMMVNMALALACIYIVMAALFESVLAPTAIITGIVFSFVGVYWFFFLTHTAFSFMAMIGMLVLMGVVVNNGIVLIERVHQLR